MLAIVSFCFQDLLNGSVFDVGLLVELVAKGAAEFMQFSGPICCLI